MTKITLTDLVNLQNENTAVSAINNNSAVITTAFDNTLSRDGTNPNQMEANIDMNSHRLLNLPAPTSNYEPIRSIDVNTINSGGITVSPLPAGGTANQVLAKNSSTNYDISWKSSTVPSGGVTGQVLVKNSNSDNDTGWSSSPTLTSINVGASTFTFPPTSDTIVGTSNFQNLSNKTIDGSNGNTFANVPVSALAGGLNASTSTYWRGDGSWSTPPTASVVALETITLNGAATYNSSVSWSGYSSIELIYMGVSASTSVFFGMMLHSNGSYQNTNYATANQYVNPGVGTNVIQSQPASLPTTYIPLFPFGTDGANSVQGAFGRGTLMNINATPGATTGAKYFIGQAATQFSTHQYNTLIGGVWNGTTAVDGCQFFLNGSGVFNLGIIKIYGIV